jgi:hypothetical protein
MVAYVALYTCPVLAHPQGDSRTEAFHRVSRAVEHDLATHPPAGLLAYMAEPEGPRPLPAYVPEGAGVAPTLSVWQDLESAFRYSYRSEAHRGALRRRHEWFRWLQHPIYVLWYVDRPDDATWDAAVARMDRLVREGPGPAAFDFLHPFTPDGEPIPPRAVRGTPEDDHPVGGTVRLPLSNA